MKKKLIALAIILSMILAPSAVWAQNDGEEDYATGIEAASIMEDPVMESAINNMGSDLMEAEAQGGVEAQSTSIFDFEDGHVPDYSGLPSRYDLTAGGLVGMGTDDVESGQNIVSKVKLQNPFGSCWAFAAIAAAEGDIIADARRKAGKDNATDIDPNDPAYDLSEKHLAYFANEAIGDENSSQYKEGMHFFNEEEMTAADKLDEGGMAFYAAKMFASGAGVVRERQDESLEYRGAEGNYYYFEDENGNIIKYCYSEDDDWSIDESMRFLSDYTLQESCMLPTPATYVGGKYRFNIDAVHAIQQQIVSGKPVSLSFMADKSKPDDEPVADEEKYMSENWAHFTYDEGTGTNHAVTVVGYDDNYPAENFNPSHQPEGDGAFLIKNSWGSDALRTDSSEENEFPNKDTWGLENENGLSTGYFWLSYYDRSINRVESFDFVKTPRGESNYRIQQYDLMPAASVEALIFTREAVTANVFQADGNSVIRKATCETATPGTTVKYELFILNDEYANPQDGIKVWQGSETYKYGGFHSIDLDKEIVVPDGKKYSIIVTQSVPGEGYETSFSLGYNEESMRRDGVNYYYKSVVNEGESYIAHGDRYHRTWYDWQEFKEVMAEDDYEVDNCPIKAIIEPTTKEAGDYQEVVDDPIPLSGAKFKISGSVFTYTGSEIKPKVSNVTLGQEKLIYMQDYTVKYEKNKYVGTGTVKVVGKSDRYKGEVKATFTIRPKGTSISSLTAGKRQFTARWRKQSAQTNGYQLRYSLRSSMSGAGKVTVTKNSTVRKTIKSLKAKKKYYVQIRTYKKVGSKTYYSAWSAKKTVKTR